MKIQITEALSSLDQLQIFNLWNAVYPIQAVFALENDFKKYLNAATDKVHYVCRNGDESIGGWLMTFTRDNDRYSVLLVSESNQGKGIGRELLEKMQEMESKVFAWLVISNAYIKLDGSLYHSPINFYKKFGFVTTNEILEKNDFSTIKLEWRKASS